MSPPCEADNSFEKFFSYHHATSRGGESIISFTWPTSNASFTIPGVALKKKGCLNTVCGLANLEAMSTSSWTCYPPLRSCSLTSHTHNIKCRRDTFHLSAYIRSTHLYRFFNNSTKSCIFFWKRIYGYATNFYAMLQSYVDLLQLKLLPPLRSFHLPQMHMTTSSAAGETLLIYLHTIYY